MAVWSIVNLSALYGERRLDAECYRPAILRDEHALETLKTVRLGDIATVTDGQHGYHDVDPDSPVRHITAKCVLQGRVDGDNVDRLAKSTHDANKRSQLTVDDILLSTAGRIGEAGLVSADILPANIDQDVARVTLNAGAPVTPDFLTVFLNSEFGRFQSERATTGQIQCHISLATLRNFHIPVVPWQNKAGGILRDSINRAHMATMLQSEAEAILTAALGLDRVALTPRLFYEDTYAHAADAARFDSEYYQPAKWNVLRALAAMPGKPLEEHFRPVKKLWQPTEQAASATVRNYDLTDALTPFLDDTTPTATAGEIKSTKKHFEPGDLVVSRLRSYLKEIAVVLPSDGAPLVGSTEFIVLRSRKTGLSAEALLAFLRSTPIQTVLKWCQDGSNHPRFGEKELLRLPIPDTVLKVQDEISAKIKEAIAARQESRRLLDEAKRTVESAIIGKASNSKHGSK